MIAIVVGLFVLFHLAHYTFAWVHGAEVQDPVTGQWSWKNYLELKDSKGRHDVYSMMVIGFTTPWLCVLYIIAQVARWQGRDVFAFTRPGDVAGQRFARSLGAVWAGGSEQMPPEPLDCAIIFAPVGSLVPAQAQ